MSNTLLHIVLLLLCANVFVSALDDVNIKYSPNPLNIKTLEDLSATITTGPNKKVGFLTPTNFMAVQHRLPSDVEPVYLLTTSSIEEQVNNGTLVAGMITGQPTEHFNVFQARVVSAKAMLMKKDNSLLAKVLNAAIIRVIHNNVPFQIGENNKPSVVVQLNSCPFGDLTIWPYPTVNELNEEDPIWWNRTHILIGSLGNVNWAQDGNYLDTQNPRGYWPDYYEAIAHELDVQYGDSLTLKRKYFYYSSTMNNEIYTEVFTPALAYAALNGGQTCCAFLALEAPCYCTEEAVDASEPYFQLDGVTYTPPDVQANFTGSTDGTDVLTVVTVSGGVISIGHIVYGTSIPAKTSITDFLSGTYGGVGTYKLSNVVPTTSAAALTTKLPGLARTTYLGHTCTTLGGDTYAFTKYYEDIPYKVLSDGEIAGVVIGGLVLLVSLFFLWYMIHKERAGSPLFLRLQDHEEHMVARSGTDTQFDSVEMQSAQKNRFTHQL